MKGRSPGATLMLCRECGYDLRGTDLVASEHHCPECGTINIPNHPRVAPITSNRLPPFVLLSFGMTWPGISISACAMLTAAVPPAGCLFASLVLILIVACFAWPPGYAELLATTRVPKVRRVRWVVWATGVGIFANIGAAITLGIVGVLVGTRVGRLW